MKLSVEIAIVLDGKRTAIGTIPLEFSVQHQERKYVTRRQQQILDLVAAGKSNKEIGAEICISERTVKFHVSSLLRRYAVRSRVQLMAKAKL
jgi:two-component system, NarL family, nitrate/nitrite response regulator NarL